MTRPELQQICKNVNDVTLPLNLVLENAKHNPAGLQQFPKSLTTVTLDLCFSAGRDLQIK